MAMLRVSFLQNRKLERGGREIERDLFLFGCGMGEVGRKRERNFFVRMWRGRKGKGREGERSSAKVIMGSGRERERRNPFLF